jgi:hypothetical protein
MAQIEWKYIDWIDINSLETLLYFCEQRKEYFEFSLNINREKENIGTPMEKVKNALNYNRKLVFIKDIEHAINEINNTKSNIGKIQDQVEEIISPIDYSYLNHIEIKELIYIQKEKILILNSKMLDILLKEERQVLIDRNPPPLLQKIKEARMKAEVKAVLSIYQREKQNEMTRIRELYINVEPIQGDPMVLEDKTYFDEIKCSRCDLNIKNIKLTCGHMVCKACARILKETHGNCPILTCNKEITSFDKVIL